MRIFQIIILLSIGSLTGTNSVLSKNKENAENKLVGSSIDAYEQYWQAFEAYEAEKVRELSNKLEEGLLNLQTEFVSQKSKLESRKLDALNNAIEQYQAQLRDFPSSVDRPYVMLNLALALNRIGDHYIQTNSELGLDKKRQALKLLSKINDEFEYFDKADEAAYLRALLLASIGQNEAAFRVWKALADGSRKSAFRVYAAIAVGDQFFDKENAESAFEYYQLARKLLNQIESGESYVSLSLYRINYRIAWAAYRAAKLKSSVNASLDLIKPLTSNISFDEGKKFKADAIDLLADALYEIDDMNYTRKVLDKSLNGDDGSAVVFSMLKRYSAAELSTQVIELGKVGIKKFPSALYSPKILLTLAEAYRNLNDDANYIATLEKIAMMMPEESLWRMRHKRNFNQLRSLQQQGLAATEILATKKYESAIKTGSRGDFDRAYSYYEILAKIYPNHERVSYWTLRLGHSLYFREEYDKASQVYSEIIESKKSPDQVLEMAMYQNIYAGQKIWQKAIGEQSRYGDPNNDPIVIEKLRSFERSVEQFANRFPEEETVVEVLLLAASISRDMERYADASRYWQRVLLSKPSWQQRKLAIRGLVLCEMKQGSPGDVIEAVSRFLKLEDWSKLGESLRNELRGTLKSSLEKQAGLLERQGKLREAAQLLVSSAETFENLPNKGSLYRDGGYYYAMNGNWKDALQVYQMYTNASADGYLGDMLYLRARAFEYSLNFKDSAKAYYDLGKRVPKHERALWSIKRSVSLYLSVGDKELAAEATLLLARRKDESDLKDARLLEAADLYSQSEKYETARALVKEVERTSKEIGYRLRAKIKSAQIDYQSGNAIRALSSLRNLSKEIERAREKIDRSLYRELRADVYTVLAQESLDELLSFRLADQSLQISEAVRQKLAIFDRYSRLQNELLSLGGHFAAKARFQIAENAETIALDIERWIASQSTSANKTQMLSLKSQSARLKNLAESYHSENVSSNKIEVRDTRSRLWIKKSIIKLAGIGQALQGGDADFYQLPVALSSGAAKQWSVD